MPPFLVSMTMTNNRETTIGRALASAAPLVDACLLIDMGVTDKTLNVARAAAEDKLVVVRHRWPGRFDDARNASLLAANMVAKQRGWPVGQAWALMLDSDEWVTGDGAALRAELGSVSEDLVLVRSAELGYTRERLFRLPTILRFDGPTHEAVTVPSTRIAKNVAVHEEGAPIERVIEKRERDVRLLRDHLKKNPGAARWWYYLGEALQGLGRLPEAIRAYSSCVDKRGWDEEAAWAFYKMAECHCEEKCWSQAIDACALGLARRGDVAELAWLAGWASYQAGWNAQAVRWARISTALGAYAGLSKDQMTRIGFRYSPGLWEGPFNVLRFALPLLGDTTGAAHAEVDFQAAMAARLATEKQ